jgi:hypothetical protein
MYDESTHEPRERSRQMRLAEKRAILRAILRMRFHCARCPIKSRGFHLDPCYGCIVLPRECRRPMTTVN